MDKGKGKDLGEEQSPGQDTSSEDKDSGKGKSPEKIPAPPTAKDLLKLDPRKIKAIDLFRFKPEELTLKEAWQLDPTGEARDGAPTVLRAKAGVLEIAAEIPVYVEPEERKKLDNPPTLTLEYLQGGTLSDFINDKLPKEKTIPSRLLWSFLLCLTRACIGMVDPPNPPTEKSKPDPPYEPIETAKERRPCSPLNSFHNAVYLEIADEKDPMDMHPFGIRLKEQGRKKWVPPKDNISVGPFNNIWGVGCLTRAATVQPVSQVMYFLIMKKYPSDPTPFTVPLDVTEPSTSLSTWGSRLLYDSDTKDAVPDVDMWLRRLVARCLADSPDERPNHRELVDDCQDAMRMMAAPESDRFASAPSETNDAIADFLKWNLFAPSPDVGPALGDPFPPNPFGMPEEEFGQAEEAGQAEQAEQSDDEIL
ncbi:kinase-like domain-containing protein [Apiospora marii]|uniref:Kinase-like domain-containing protein n=1 Tax=Apiospora marii TaxID=335849 RepID=A0ABR1RDQ6_9PEZI